MSCEKPLASQSTTYRKLVALLPTVFLVRYRLSLVSYYYSQEYSCPMQSFSTPLLFQELCLRSMPVLRLDSEDMLPKIYHVRGSLSQFPGGRGQFVIGWVQTQVFRSGFKYIVGLMSQERVPGSIFLGTTESQVTMKPGKRISRWYPIQVVHHRAHPANWLPLYLLNRGSFWRYELFIIVLILRG